MKQPRLTSRCWRFRKNQKGFTLMEVLVTTTLSTFLLAAIYMTFLMGNKTARHFTEQVLIRSQARLALNATVTELREAQDVVMEKKESYVAIRFKRRGKGTVLYRWYKEGEMAGKLMRTSCGRSRQLAKNIVRFDVRQPTQGRMGIVVSAGLEDQKNAAPVVTLKGMVALRQYLTFMDQKQ